MKKASITETKNRLSALLDTVRSGESVLIMDRGKPVARLDPVSMADAAESGAHLSQLERSGLIRLGSTKPARLIVEKEPPRAKKGSSVLRALIANRAEER